jgi:hypothetical protein
MDRNLITKKTKRKEGKMKLVIHKFYSSVYFLPLLIVVLGITSATVNRLAGDAYGYLALLVNTNIMTGFIVAWVYDKT